jgi:hypothetical protein
MRTPLVLEGYIYDKGMFLIKPKESEIYRNIHYALYDYLFHDWELRDNLSRDKTKMKYRITIEEIN